MLRPSKNTGQGDPIDRGFSQPPHLRIGALPIGLRHNRRDALAQRKEPTQYDIITNICTTEHVRDNQAAVWTNLWQCLKPGGWLECPLSAGFPFPPPFVVMR